MARKEARLILTYPCIHGGVGFSNTIVEGRNRTFGSGFMRTERQLRKEFEHFVTDLKLIGAFDE